VKDGFIISALSVTPKKSVARFIGLLARTPLPGIFNRAVLRFFVWKYKVNLSECQGEIKDYKSLSEFFLRKLKPGVRPIDPDPKTMVSPVDGKAYAFGPIENDRFFQSEGKAGSVKNLLGNITNAEHPLLDPLRYEGGHYAVIYLSPTDYHRVHSPFDGDLKCLNYLPGKLWPVFPAATRKIDNLFDKNERLVFGFDTPSGAVALVMVGAFGVGRMRTPFSDLCTNQKEPGRCIEISEPLKIEKGEEIGAFELGSTVILLTEKGCLAGPDAWKLIAGSQVVLGEPIAHTVTSG